MMRLVVNFVLMIGLTRFSCFLVIHWFMVLKFFFKLLRNESS